MRLAIAALILAVLLFPCRLPAQDAGGGAAAGDKGDDKSPLEKIRIDAAQSSKRDTGRSSHYYYYYSDDFQKAIITVRPSLRNDGKEDAKDLRVTTYLLGRMVADTRLYRIIAKSTQQVSVPVKKDATLEPLIATARYTSGKGAKRGARDCGWLVVVRDADGLFVGAACANGQEGMLKILKTIEKADCGTRWREGVTYFNGKGEIAHVDVGDFDYDYID